MADNEKDRQLQQELRDERARRREAEQRLEDLTERADLWRRRAEERTERIERLLAGQQRPSSPLRRWAPFSRIRWRAFSSSDARKPVQPAEPAQSTPPPEPPSSSVVVWPGLMATRAVSALADPGMSRALDAFDHSPLTLARESDLDRADLVVVDPATFGSLDADSQERFTAWLDRPGRQPLIVWTGRRDLGDLAARLNDQDVIVASDPEVAADLGVHFLPGCLDPRVHHPMGQSGDRRSTMETSMARAPTLDVIERAASGEGFSAEPGAGIAARRWAYRHHAPWTRAHQLLQAANVASRDPVPAIAAILVSHRPHDIPAAIQAVSRQTHRPGELVVGIHGGEVTTEIDAAIAASDIPVTLLTFDRGLTLGECLDLAAAKTTSPVLAKIDDDDHYGPAHLEDSFHALSYSGADIVGKGAHFTYMATNDSTVLRRPGLEETFIDGSPNGATLVFRRDVWDRVGFARRPRHVDTAFLRAARGIGATVYAGSRWEFCYVRRADGHTWDAEDQVFTAGSEPAWDGYQPGRVEVPDVRLD